MREFINSKSFCRVLTAVFSLLVYTICQSQPILVCPGGISYGHWEFSPDGSKIVNHVTNCSTKRTWDLASGKMITLDTGCSFGDRWIELQPTGKLAFTRAEWKDSVKVWELSTGRLKYILKGYCGEFSPDGSLILTNIIDPDSTMIWDSNTGNLLYSRPGAYAEFSRDGKWMINSSNIQGTNYSSINIFESASGHLFRNLIDERYAIGLITEDNRYIIIEGEKKIKTYDFTSGEKRGSIKFGDWDGLEEGLYFNMILSNEISKNDSEKRIGEANLIQISTGKLIKKIKWSCCKCMGNELLEPNKTAYSPNGKHLYIHLDCSTAGIVECATGDLISTMKIGEYSDGTKAEIIKFSKDCKWLGTSHKPTRSESGRTKIWDIKTGKLIWEIEGFLNDFHPIKSLVIINQDTGCSLISLDSGKVLLSWFYLGYDDWVVRHHTGLFDASRGALDKLYFIVDGKRTESSELKDMYYEPGLWEKTMSGRPIRTIKN